MWEIAPNKNLSSRNKCGLSSEPAINAIEKTMSNKLCILQKYRWCDVFIVTSMLNTISKLLICRVELKIRIIFSVWRNDLVLIDQKPIAVISDWSTDWVNNSNMEINQKIYNIYLWIHWHCIMNVLVGWSCSEYQSWIKCYSKLKIILAIKSKPPNLFATLTVSWDILYLDFRYECRWLEY